MSENIPEYRENRNLSPDELNAIIGIKGMANSTGHYLDTIEDMPHLNLDKRWLAIARTNLQQGYMALIRSIAKPEGF